MSVYWRLIDCRYASTLTFAGVDIKSCWAGLRTLPLSP